MNQSTSPPVNGFVLVPQEENICEQVFFDGVTEMLVGAANCKISFHQVVGVDASTAKERRKLVLTAVLPMSSMAELCVNFLNTVGQNKEVLENALHEHKNKVFSEVTK